MTDYIAQKALIPLHFEVISLTDSTAIALSTTAQGAASVLDISVETQPVRYRADGTDPTLSTGVILEKDVNHRWHGFNGTSVLKFQRTTGTATVSVQSWSLEPGGDR